MGAAIVEENTQALPADNNRKVEGASQEALSGSNIASNEVYRVSENLSLVLDPFLPHVIVKGTHHFTSPVDPKFGTFEHSSILRHISEHDIERVNIFDTCPTPEIVTLVQELLKRGIQVHFRDHHQGEQPERDRDAAVLQKLMQKYGQGDNYQRSTRSESPSSAQLIESNELNISTSGSSPGRSLTIISPFDLDACVAAAKAAGVIRPPDSPADARKLSVINDAISRVLGAGKELGSLLEWDALLADSRNVQQSRETVQRILSFTGPGFVERQSTTEIFFAYYPMVNGGASSVSRTADAAALLVSFFSAASGEMPLSKTLEGIEPYAGALERIKNREAALLAAFNDRDSERALTTDADTRRITWIDARDVETMDSSSIYYGAAKQILGLLRRDEIAKNRSDKLFLIETEHPKMGKGYAVPSCHGLLTKVSMHKLGEKEQAFFKTGPCGGTSFFVRERDIDNALDIIARETSPQASIGSPGKKEKIHG